MIPPRVDSQLVLLVLLWLCVMLPHLWPSPLRGMPTRPADSSTPQRTRSSAPTPCAGLTHQPPCALWAQVAGESAPASPLRPAPLPPMHRRPRPVDTSLPCCPPTECAYRGWLGLGKLRANGHPSGGPWRQFPCLSCNGYFPEHHGTLLHGKQAAVEQLVRVLACLAEG